MFNFNTIFNLQNPVFLPPFSFTSKRLQQKTPRDLCLLLRRTQIQQAQSFLVLHLLRRTAKMVQRSHVAKFQHLLNLMPTRIFEGVRERYCTQFFPEVRIALPLKGGVTFQVSFPSTSCLALSAIANMDQIKVGSWNLDQWGVFFTNLELKKRELWKDHSSFTFFESANPPKETTMAIRLRIRTQLFVIIAHAKTHQENITKLDWKQHDHKCDGTLRISTPRKRSDRLHVLLGV